MRWAWAALVGCMSCGAQPVRRPLPVWASSPPAHTASHLYFTGDSSGAPNSAAARELAVQRALANLSQYCGAEVSSSFTALEREVDGKVEQSIALKIEVSGDHLTLREAVLEGFATRPNPRAGVDGYALIRWPRAQYERVLAMQKARGERALALYLEAEKSLRDLWIARARHKLGEAEALLGKQTPRVPLAHPQMTNTALLREALTALEQEARTLDAERRRMISVGVDCSAAPRVPQSNCPARRAGHIRQRVTAGGWTVSSTELSNDLARTIANAKTPDPAATPRESGYILAVAYDAETLGEEDGFAFARCGARGVLLESETRRIVDTTEVPPQKGGHLHYRGAVAEGCAQAEARVVVWLEKLLEGFSGTTSESAVPFPAAGYEEGAQRTPETP